jgi:hypothetical protein
MEMEENDALGDEADLVDAPSVGGRQAHIEDQLGHPIDTDKDTDR